MVGKCSSRMRTLPHSGPFARTLLHGPVRPMVTRAAEQLLNHEGCRWEGLACTSVCSDGRPSTRDVQHIIQVHRIQASDGVVVQSLNARVWLVSRMCSREESRRRVGGQVASAWQTGVGTQPQDPKRGWDKTAQMQLIICPACLTMQEQPGAAGSWGIG